MSTQKQKQPPKLSLNDGVVSIYHVANTAQPGELPVEGLTLKHTLRYEKRTVGFKRLYAAMQAQAQIDLLIRVPYLPTVSTQDVAVPTDGKQYRITAAQSIAETQPLAMDLTLERLEHDYELL